MSWSWGLNYRTRRSDGLESDGMLPPTLRSTISMSRSGPLPVFALVLALAAAAVHAQQARPPAAPSLPDWSGVWAMQGGTVFDRGTIKPPNATVNTPGAREFPPYNAEWEAKYAANLKRVADGS